MLSRFACVCLVAGVTGLVTGLVSGTAVAQAKKQAQPPAVAQAKKQAQPQTIDIDLEEEEGKGGKAAPSGPAVAGQMSQKAAQAKRLFDGEKWARRPDRKSVV